MQVINWLWNPHTLFSRP
uniref:Uncharacterized protein n=1 Tax=Anguilla anguilla TaxID=7936 RepID=A0A0E9UEI1_ANGAN